MNPLTEKEIDQLGKRAKILSTISFLALVYYFAGGSFESEFKFLGGGITFSNPDRLEFFALAFYLIIYYRYYILLSGRLKEIYIHQRQAVYAHISIKKYVQKIVYNYLVTLESVPEHRIKNYRIEKTTIPEHWTEVLFSEEGFRVGVDGYNDNYIGLPGYGFRSYELFKIRLKMLYRYLVGMNESHIYFYPTLIFAVTFFILIKDWIFNLFA
ncbi:MAG: hypothetical protein ED557_14945 [Balneola sp.]|nr:MAG: hypothetical protein ED557_14945 [Balneola sp.]